MRKRDAFTGRRREGAQPTAGEVKDSAAVGVACAEIENRPNRFKVPEKPAPIAEACCDRTGISESGWRC